MGLDKRQKHGTGDKITIEAAEMRTVKVLYTFSRRKVLWSKYVRNLIISPFFLTPGIIFKILL
jgi:hypothetical protein